MNHFGTLEDLKAAVDQCKLIGTWSELTENGLYQFRSRSGEILNWWPSKGTLLIQGKNTDRFKERLSASLDQPIPTSATAVPVAAKIFLVHGHDIETRDQLELVLMRLGLQPFILQNADGGGKTITEALEQHIYREAAFGIVLLTPDDYGYPKDKMDADRQPRARQNVILEMGMVMAALGRERMVILKKGALELPSDANGILYIEFNQHVKEIVPKLAQRLQAVGFDIDSGKIVSASQ